MMVASTHVNHSALTNGYVNHFNGRLAIHVKAVFLIGYSNEMLG